MPITGIDCTIPSLLIDTGWIEIVQRPVYQQFTQHGQLLNRQRQAAVRAFEFTSKVGSQHIERGEGFAGVA
jgi:hypothetical protein